MQSVKHTTKKKRVYVFQELLLLFQRCKNKKTLLTQH